MSFPWRERASGRWQWPILDGGRDTEELSNKRAAPSQGSRVPPWPLPQTKFHIWREKSHKSFLFPLLLQVHTLGDLLHKVRDGGKVSNEAKLLHYGAPELLMLINNICSVAITSPGLGKFCRYWLSGCLLRSWRNPPGMAPDQRWGMSCFFAWVWKLEWHHW